MNRRHVILGAAAVLAIATISPALGGPSNPVATTAAALKKKVNRALSTANEAKTAANDAQAAANAAQAAASAANAAAANALSTAQGKQSQIRWAFITGAGAITSQSGGISVTSSSGGNFYVNFGSSQVNRALIASVHSALAGIAHAALCGGTGNPGGVSCGPMGTDNVNHVIVQTESPPGTSAAKAFYLASVP